MQNATITTAENQIDISVVTNENRTKGFAFGETNEMRIVQLDENKNTFTSMLCTDGLGVNDTAIVAQNTTGNVRVSMKPDGSIVVYKNELYTFEI